MEYKIEYLPSLETDMIGIFDYLSQFYESTFINFFNAFEKRIALLRNTPCMGAVYKQYRKLVFSNYLVFYTVDETCKTVKIHRVLHGARDWANQDI